MASSTIRIEMPVKVIDNMNAGLNQMTEKFNKLEQAVMKASNQVKNAGRSMAESFREAGGQVSRFDREIEKAQRNFMKMTRERYQIVLEAVDHASPVLVSIRTGLQGIIGKTWTVTVKAEDQTAGSISKILRSLKTPTLQLDKLFETGSGMQTSINSFTLLQTTLGKVKTASIEMGKSLDVSNVANGASGLGETVKNFALDVLSGTISDNMASIIGSASFTKAPFGENIYNFSGKGAMGGLAKLGLKLGSTATSGAGLALSGLGAVAGGVTAATGLVMGTADAVTAIKAFKEGDSKKGRAYRGAATAETLGTIAGGAVGALAGLKMGAVVGSLIPIPVLGTLIGAGAGALVGMVAGKYIKGKYEKEAEQERILQEEKERQDEIRAKQEKYQTAEMKNAVRDLANGVITAEQASRIFTEQVNKGLRNHFGDTELSLERISKIAQSLVFGDHVKEFQQFAMATAETEKSMERLAESGAVLDRIGSKVKMNIELTKEEKESVPAETKEFVDNALDTINNQDQEMNAAIDLIYGKGKNPLRDRFTEVNESRREEAGRLGTELVNETNTAVESGSWDPDRSSEKREAIENVVNLSGDRDRERLLDLLEISHGGSGMTYESFAKIQEGMQPYREQAEQEIYAAGEVLYDMLWADKERNGMSDDDFNKEKKNIQKDVQGKIHDSNVQWESDQLGVIANAYEQKLPGILGGVKGGSLPEQLRTVLHDAIGLGTNLSGMDLPTLATSEGMQEYLQRREIGSDNVEMQGQVAAMLAGVLGTLSGEYIDSVKKKYPEKEVSDGPFAGQELWSPEAYEAAHFSGTPTTGSCCCAAEGSSYGGSADGMGYTPAEQAAQYDYYAADTIVPGIADGIANTDMGSINDAINTLKENVQAAIDSAFSAGFETSTSVRINANYSLTGGSSVPGSITTNPALQYRPHANGDIVNGPQFSLIGEDGPEAIIPLGSKRRDRGLSLWQQAGELLGVGRYADGGILSGDSGGVKTYLPSGDSGSSLPDQGNGSGINVSVNMSPTFEINNDQASGENGVVSTLKSHIRDMTDEVADELAVRLQKIFGNMPTKEA